MTRVLVGIPTLNGPDRLRRALSSVLEYSSVPDVELTVLVSDDSSDKRNLKLNKDVVHSCREHGVQMLTTETRLGVPRQWNRLVRHVPDAEVVAIINDDVEVVTDWLDVLVFTLLRNPHVGQVGLRCDTGITRSNAVARASVDYHEARLLDGGGAMLSCGGACFAFRRADWEAIGGFDERYFCFYEEIDFGVSLTTKLGRSNVIAEYPVVYHMGGATTSEHADMGEIMAESRAKFAAKWGTLDGLRADFVQRKRQPYVEWNSHWKNWRHP